MFGPSLSRHGVPIALVALGTAGFGPRNARAQDASGRPPPPTDAPRPIYEVLNKGGEWALQVNGQTATLRLLGGRGGRRSDGGYDLTFDISWGDVPGEIQGSGDADNQVRTVSFTLNYPSGASYRCDGFIAQGGNDMMAGTCGEGGSRMGAWHAERGASGGGQDAPGSPQLAALQARLRAAEARQETLARRVSESQADLSRTQAELARSESRVEAGANTLRQCQQQCKASGGVKPVPVGSLRSRGVTGQYAAGGGGKEDSAQKLDFPDPPGSNNRLANWLNAHNSALLSALRSLYPQDLPRFLDAERSACREGGIYCQIGFREQGLAAALSGAR